jgi:predicted O-linked N-acetylglucosamine transferase (SPINDLY family)
LGLRASAVVYWCCQSLPKYLPQFDGVFARIAAEVPDCQFTFIEFGGGKYVTEMFRTRLERAFREVGLNAAEHCIFLPRLTPDRFIAAIGHCDVVLDSIGWSGCNSILESLVHNVPIVTLAGEMMRGRHTAAILDMIEVRETTAQTIDEYVSIAALLGRSTAKRTELSVRIAEQKHGVYRDRDCVKALEEFWRVQSGTTEIHRKRARPLYGIAGFPIRYRTFEHGLGSFLCHFRVSLGAPVFTDKICCLEMGIRRREFIGV